MNFVGTLPPSKSLLARYLIIKSYFNELEIKNNSNCEDVKTLEKALNQFKKKSIVDLKYSATALRFLALRLSREKGEFEIKGHKRLFERPQNELIKVLNQLDVKAEITKDSLKIKSEGWNPLGDSIHINCETTSQIASSLILNSWNLKRPLHFTVQNLKSSHSYFEMTLKVLKELGMKYERDHNHFYVFKEQKITKNKVFVEPDMSCAFSIAAISALKGSSCFLDFPQSSLQPDFNFISILKTMNVPIHYVNESTLKITNTSYLKGINWDHKDTLDLFPVLACLCAFSQTPSQLTGLSNLKYKESKRLDKIIELLRLIGKKFEFKNDTLFISEANFLAPKHISFDTDHDHRIAFACSLLRKKGIPIEFSDPRVVNKSFPEFYKYIGLKV